VTAALGAAGSATPLGAQAGPTSFTFHGSGWGHGVGMSQYGARGMATNGSTADQILAYYYSGAAVTTVAENTGHRALVAPAAPSFTFTADRALVVYKDNNVPVGMTGPGSVVTVTRSGAGMTVSGALSASGGYVKIDFVGPARVSPPNHRYQFGTLTVALDGTSNLMVRNENLTMSELLYGLGEMPSLWPTESLKAQAIAARTFAQKRRAANGDLRSWMDISLIGYDKVTSGSFDRWKAAVDSTVGRVVTYNGGLIDALFSASSGGYTENSEYVFISALPYLRAKPDPGDLVAGNPHASWTRTFTAAELGSWFGVGTATSVSITGNVSVAGRTNRATIRVVGTTATKDISSTNFRNWVAGASPARALISPKFWVQAVGGTTPPPTTPPTSPPTTAPRGVVLPAGTITSAGADKTTITIAGTASDRDGAPRIRIVSTMGTSVGTRETVASGGRWTLSWTGSKGTRNICVTALDVPTGQGVSLGCKSVVVK
jgi:SpoIID/LytB domain protein